MSTPPQPPQNPQNWAGQQPPQGGYQAPPMPPAPAPKRNWFARHKILTGLIALVVIVGGICAANDGSKKSGDDRAATSPTADASSRTGTSTAATSKAAASPKATKKAKPGIGAAVRDGKFQFTVTKVVTGKASVGSQYLEQKAQGSYTLIYLTVKNIGDESQTFSDSDQTVSDASGKSYDADSTADLYIEGNDVFFQNINPGNSVGGVLAFDMPVGAKATSITLHDSMFSGGVTVQLQ